MEITINTVCADCGSDLDGEESRGGTLRVKFCSDCADNIRAEGHQDGYEDGLSDGADEEEELWRTRNFFEDRTKGVARVRVVEKR